MNVTTLLRNSLAAFAVVAAGLSEASAQQPRFTGYVPIIHPTAKAPAFGPRSTIPGYESMVTPMAGPSARFASGWAPAAAARPVLLIDPQLSNYETWAQFDNLRGNDPSQGANVRHREPGQALNQFSHRDGVDYR